MIGVALAMAGLSIGSTTDAAAQSSSATGGLHGVLHERATGEPAAAATVVATSPSLQGEEVMVADEYGRYWFVGLPPGVYVLTVYYNDNTSSRTDVLVQAGQDTSADMQLEAEQKSAPSEGIDIWLDERLMIDEGSTRTGVRIGSDFTNNVPLGRTFGDVIRLAPGAQLDAYGTSIAGATSPENIYLINGLDTTDTGFGTLSSNLPNEFVEETEVMTGGYNAEYGHATGGIVNVVTKQGSNEFHGTVFGYYTPGSLSAAAKTIEREGDSIATHQDLDRAYDVGAEVGGPIVKDHLWFHVGFDPSTQHTVTTRLVQSQVDKVNNATGADGGDGIPDVDPATGITLHAPVSSSLLPEHRTTYFFTAKIDGAIDPNNQFELSVSGNPSTGSADNFNSAAIFAPGDEVFHASNGAYDASAKYMAKRDDAKTQIDVMAGFHRGYSTTTPVNDQQRLPLTHYGYTRDLTDFEDLEGSAIAPTLGGNVQNTCNDSDPHNPYPMLGVNCPVANYAESGLGLLENRINDRWSAIASITQRAKMLGYHTFKAGVELDVSSYISDQGYTGGSELRRSQFGVWQLDRFLGVVGPPLLSGSVPPDAVLCDGGESFCAPVDSRHIDTHDRSLGAYVQDSWQIEPNLTINGGLRFDQQAVGIANGLAGTTQFDGETVPDTAFTLDNWSPRLGVIYDPTREGRSKIFAHWGRFFENVPMDMNNRSFGGGVEQSERSAAPGDIINNACPVDHAPGVIPSQVLQSCTSFAETSLVDGRPEYVAPNLNGQHVDELVLGGEYELTSSIRLGLTYTHRSIGDVIEDMSTDGANTFVIANPGRNYAAEAAALEAQAEQDILATPLGAHLEQEARQLALLKEFDPPSRNYDAVTFRVDATPTHHSLVTASYTYAAERGNYPGLFSTETNQLDPNITSQYDRPDLMANRYGPLGLDRPHRLELDGFYRFDLGNRSAITTGVSLRGQSGIAHNALGTDPSYGSGETYLLPRGSIARSPFTSQLDVHLAYRHRLGRTMFVEAFADIFNLFDQQDELTVDENYTFDTTTPIVGGDMTDLAHLKSHGSTGLQSNETVTPNKNFDHTSALTPPRSVRLGVRLSF